MLRAKPSREVRIDCRHSAGGPLDGVTVTILNADKRIGTHVFATVARNDAGLRWTAVTIDNGERRQRRARPYHHPTGCTRSHRADRNARSSIIVSGEPLSRETTIAPGSWRY
jgi:hypothetical protein